MHRHTLRQLEMHLTHACNLKCKYCSHYCDFKYGGKIPYIQGEMWIRSWAKRLAPQKFRILGGEPLLHKDAEKYVRLCAECFPKAKRDFVTNGLLLRKRKSILPVLMETDTVLHISLHPLASERQEALVNDAVHLARQYQDKGLRLNIARSASRWRKFYREEGAAILPFAGGNPEKSFSCCCSRCPTLHQGKLWKCPPLAYLPLIVDQLETKRFWEPYLQYKPLEIDASDEALAAFAKGDSQFCDMCPTEPHMVSVEGIIPQAQFKDGPIKKFTRKINRLINKLKNN